MPYEALADAKGADLLSSYIVSYATSATMLSYIKPAGGAESMLVAGISFSDKAVQLSADPVEDQQEQEQLYAIAMRGRGELRGAMLAGAECPDRR